jgi:glycosyltransferase involved in cell wall biosynthesis
VLEAMAHGCIPILSDLPANRELVRDGANGLILADGQGALSPAALERLQADANRILVANRAWVGANALFGPSVDAFVARLEQLSARAALT